MFIDPTDPNESLEEKVAEELGSDSPLTPADDAALEAYNLSLKGYTVGAISKKLGVSSSQVSSWIRSAKNEFRDTLTEQSGAELLSSLLEEYEFLKAFAFGQLQDICVEVSKEGKVSKKKVDHSAAAKYLDIIAKTIKDRADLLSRTGALPKEPDKLDINIRGENKTEVTHKIENEERTEEQILKDIHERLKHASTL